MEGVRARFGGHVHCAGRRQIGGNIETGLADLEFVDRAGWYVGGRGAHGFVADINAVNVDAGGAAEAAAERDRRVASLGRVKVLTVLNLNAGLELREVEEVAPVDRQVRNLVLESARLGRQLAQC